MTKPTVTVAIRAHRLADGIWRAQGTGVVSDNYDADNRIAEFPVDPVSSKSEAGAIDAVKDAFLRRFPPEDYDVHFE